MAATLAPALPHVAARTGARLRVAFVGQTTFFEACALTHPAGGIEPVFIEFRKGGDEAALLTQLAAFDPHVVAVFRPEIIPPGLLAELDAARLGFLTEPLPRVAGGTHPDLERRLDDLRQVDVGNFDRIVSFDPLIAETADQVLPVWRSLPLPVNDRYFRPVDDGLGRPRVLFVGRSTEHRERMLTPSKHQFDVLHLAFGVHGDRLEQEMDGADVGINLHNEPYPSFENRVSLHLAAGHLVISEPLSPLHGLEPNIDFLEVSTPGQVLEAIERLHRFPGMFQRVRVRGRRKAELFRASRVWPRLVLDLLTDVG